LFSYTFLMRAMPHDTVERLREIDGMLRIRKVYENKNQQ